MLTYWVKHEDGGWVITLARRRVAGPYQDQDAVIEQAAEMARSNVHPMVSTRVVVREKDGSERPAGRFGPKAGRGRLTVLGKVDVGDVSIADLSSKLRGPDISEL